jgi:Tfp pilus assembly protein FimT
MPQFYRPPTPELGATLLELFAVMAIISIVTATAAPAICKAKAHARDRIRAWTFHRTIQLNAGLSDDFDNPTITGVWPEHP